MKLSEDAQQTRQQYVLRRTFLL